jgi:hypothetical protein
VICGTGQSDDCKTQWQLHKEQTAAAAAMAAAVPKPPAVMAQTPLNGITEANAEQIRNPLALPDLSYCVLQFFLEVLYFISRSAGVHRPRHCALYLRRFAR